jgi:hypothetical protein
MIKVKLLPHYMNIVSLMKTILAKMRRELACLPHQLHGRVQLSEKLLEGKIGEE